MERSNELATDGRPWFEARVRLWERPAYQFSLMLTQNPAIAEEIVQEAFAQLWASPKTPSDETEFRRWLYQVVASRATDYQRRQALSRRLRPWVARPPDPMEEFDRRTGDREMAAALRRLSPRERQAAYLYYFEDQPAEEIGAALGISASTVRVLLHRAIQKLKQFVPELRAQEQSS